MSGRDLALRATIVAAALLAVTRGPAVESPAAGAAPLVEAPAGAPVQTAADPAVVRARYALLNLDVLPGPDEHRTLRQPAIPLELFQGVTLFAEFERFDPNPTGVTWVGRVEGVPMSNVTLVSSGGLIAGSITMPSAVYRIAPAPVALRDAHRQPGRELHEIAQIDQAALPPEAEPIEFSPTPAQLALAADAPMGDTHGIIDILVVYTASAAQFAGGQAGMANLINLGVSATNTAFASSGVTHRLRLVHTAQVGYAETGAFLQSLTDLRSEAGVLAEVHALRNQHGADLVAMLVRPASPNACGIAFLMTSVSPAFAAAAFSVTDAACVSPGHTFAHEIGHNMGLRHDWFMDAGVTPFTYAHGYVNTTSGQRWRTIMAYPNLCTALGVACTRLLNFSNPDLRATTECDSRFDCSLLRHWYFPGMPMGVPGGTRTTCQPGNLTNPHCDADARRALNVTAPTVANFRQSIHGSDRR